MKVRSYKNTGRLPGGLVFAVSAASALVAHADYQSTVLSFNPAGYWRLSEAAPVPGVADVITNYGSLGSAGNGYAGPDLTNRLVAGIAGPSMTFQNPGASY